MKKKDDDRSESKKGIVWRTFTVDCRNSDYETAVGKAISDLVLEEEPIPPPREVVGPLPHKIPICSECHRQVVKEGIKYFAVGYTVYRLDDPRVFVPDDSNEYFKFPPPECLQCLTASHNVWAARMKEERARGLLQIQVKKRRAR
jgi:hypothetical protein